MSEPRAKISVKRYAVADETIYAILTDIWARTGVGNPARGDDLATIQTTLRHGGLIILAYHGDTAIGATWLTHDWRRLYIHHMAVLEEFRDQGVGRMLLNEALAYASEIGIQPKLEVHHANPRARHLYESAGFTYIEGYWVMVKRG
ncbi:MAG TPA: GNAT family N-acetyltransferase [Candidatus Cloacimonadota bacterium]|nr:GNAT family N-acetyltransferase [Candidatus Cloacimonadota bacterium]HOH78454.1 GNAT family N-acetyltransferase [Candidatus Cloacimonadota bacterium]